MNNFSNQIKKLRASKNLTQEQMANKLNISRQAVSNWENDRNLPDIEMLIAISKTFNISLDELILGENEMNNMTKKLIDDTNENKRAKLNLISVSITGILLLLGFGLLALRSIIGDKINADGTLEEPFFLVIFAFAFFALGFIASLISFFVNVVKYSKNKNSKTLKNNILLSLSPLFGILGMVFVLIEANSGVHTLPVGIICFVVAACLIIYLLIKRKK